jgi:hypothetical protein
MLAILRKDFIYLLVPNVNSELISFQFDQFIH